MAYGAVLLWEAAPRSFSFFLSTLWSLQIASVVLLPISVFLAHPLPGISLPLSQPYLRGCDIGCICNVVAPACMLICHALHCTAACCLSPAVAGRAALYRAVHAWQLLERKVLQVNPAGWHRFCLLLEGREFRGPGESWQRSVRQVRVAGLGTELYMPLRLTGRRAACCARAADMGQ